MAVKLSNFLNTSFAVSTLDSADVTGIINTTSILLDSGTSGDYVKNITAGNGITVTGGGAHSATPTVAVDTTVTATLNDTQTLTNKTFNLTNNTLQTTFNQLNAAVSGATLVSLNGAETLTNKTLTSPVITGPQITGPGSITDISTFGLRDQTTTSYETRIQSNNVSPVLSADRTLTLDVNNDDRTISLTGNISLAGNLITGGAFTTVGAHNTTLATTGNTLLTLPTSGTVITKDSSGDFTIAGTMTGEVDRSANTSVSAGSYGSSSLIPIITVDANGFVDSVSTVTVDGMASTSFDSSTGAFTITMDNSETFTTAVYTRELTRTAISAGGDLSYNSTTGVMSFSETYSSPSELLTAIKTVDGVGSGLDADLLDGQQGSYYRINVYDASGTLLN